MTVTTTPSITFAVGNVQPAKKPLPECQQDVIWQEVLDTTPIYCFKPKQNLVEVTGCHPLIAATHLTFSQHRPLVLSPDVIWITIAQGLALHINNHAKEMRHQFVSFEGKKRNYDHAP